MNDKRVICWFEEEMAEEARFLGGKNSSLSRMIRNLRSKGVQVPGGFATTAQAYRLYVEENDLYTPIASELHKLKANGSNLTKVGSKIRSLILKGKFSPELNSSLVHYFEELREKSGRDSFSVAVRSSATAEDLPGASFAGQLETFLNVSSSKQLLSSVKECFASLFTDRAIFYRAEKGFDHMKVALSVGVQEMVRSDLSCSGVMFSLDMESGFPDMVVINGSWGLGEYVVKGIITPDTYTVFKPNLSDSSLWPILSKDKGSKDRKLIYDKKGSTIEKQTSAKEKESFILSDAEVLELARWAVIIEEEYGMAMDMEWARDGENDKIYIVQARPETVQSQKSKGSLEQYHLNKSAKVFLTGTAVGNGIGNGPARILKTMADSSRFKDGDVLVAEMTDPDWVPLMKKASAIVTEHGGSTSHAAIVSRELGVPAVLGVKNATKKIKDGNDITVSCAEEGEGRVFHGLLDYEVTKINLDELPKTTTQVMINVSTPGGALKWWNLPVEGIGLTRLEFLINNEIKIHPMALVHPELVEDKKDQQLIKQMLAGYENYEHYFVERLGMGIAKIAASQYSQPVIIRMSDFKTNEYSKLIGGKNFEPHEENPMLGFRGASRYYHPKYREGFSLECQAFKYAREVIGLDNIIIMIPFCRTPEEADLILETMAENGLIRGDKGLKIYMMAEVPSNIFLAKEFAQRFDGFSIGSNDLTQLILGVDRDSDLLQELFSANHPAVRKAISALISDAHEEGVKVGICGQEPSDNPDFAKFLVECGIDSISLNPDSVFKLKQEISSFEQR